MRGILEEVGLIPEPAPVGGSYSFRKTRNTPDNVGFSPHAALARFLIRCLEGKA